MHLIKEANRISLVYLSTSVQLDFKKTRSILLHNRNFLAQVLEMPENGM